MPLYSCICDTSLLNALLSAVPDFPDYLLLHVPDTASRGKELRANRKVVKLILDDKIKVHELQPGAKRDIADLIGRALNGNLANLYRQGRMKHEAVEYECAFLASKLRIPVYFFDARAHRNCRRLLRPLGRDALVMSIEDFIRKAPLPYDRRLSLRNHVWTMGYPLPDGILEDDGH